LKSNGKFIQITPGVDGCQWVKTPLFTISLKENVARCMRCNKFFAWRDIQKEVDALRNKIRSECYYQEFSKCPHCKQKLFHQ